MPSALRLPAFALVVLLVPGPALAQEGGGGLPPGEPLDTRSPERQAEILEMLDTNRAALREAGRLPAPAGRGHTLLDHPLRSAEDVVEPSLEATTNFVDLDPAFPDQLLDYQCNERTYDTPAGYNHQGIDYLLWPYAWKHMDEEAVEIVAAADGVIIGKEDGHFDRNCALSNEDWNAVYLEHADGATTWYGHMKSGSLTSKEVGDSVAEGEFLGLVGSSGSSTAPHLHFEVYDGDQALIEPSVGACNETTETSWWEEQGPYYDSALNALYTHEDVPVPFVECPATEELENFKNAFDFGDQVYVAAYYRDQLEDQTTEFTLLHPSGATVTQWEHESNAPHYVTSYWYWTVNLPLVDEPGTWSLRAEYEDQVIVHPFTVGVDTDSEAAPRGYRLTRPHPNPFASEARFTLELGVSQHVRAVAVDLLGREVAVLHDGVVAAGVSQPIRFDARALPAGLYVLQVTGEHFAESFRVTHTR